MGCLFEFFYELFFEGILEIYMALMTLIVPEHRFSKKIKRRMKTAAGIFAGALFLLLLIGLALFIGEEDPFVRRIGGYLLFIPLTIIGIQTVIGILYRLISRKKKQ